MIENKTIGDRLKKMRKASGMSQTELAKILDCDQASISRLESGIQGISATQLVTIAHTYKVDLNSIATGQINYWGISRDFKRKPKVKKRYQSYLETYGREVIPIIRFLNNYKGSEYTQKLLSSLGIEDLAFIPPDEKVSLRCYLDLIGALISEGVDLQSHITKWIEHYNQKEVLGSLTDSFNNTKSPLQVTGLLVHNNCLLDSIFDQTILERKDNSFLISMKKKPYLQGVDLERTKIGPVLLNQKVKMHEEFPKLFSGQPLKGTFTKEFKKNLTGEARLILEVK